METKENGAGKRAKGFRKIIHLSFPPENSGSPVICHLVRQFDLTFSIVKAQITPRKEGHLTLEIEGLEDNWRQAVKYLKEQGIDISSAAQRISRDEDACMHCGLCTGMCPAVALGNDLETRKVFFDKDRCTACGICTRVCPVGAMRLDLADEEF